MKKIFLLLFAAGCICIVGTSCSENKAAESGNEPSFKKEPTKTPANVKPDGPAIGSAETDSYVLKLHRAFSYEPAGSVVLAGMKPIAGHKFIYLDVSLKNKSPEKLEGGFLFIALKVTDKNGTEFKKPAAALAGYTSAHPEDNNDAEYSALWESFAPNEFHREIVYAVEVPAHENNFVLHIPADRQRKEWKTISFSL
jgi:hypothetical protein